MEALTRGEATARLQALGATVTSTVTKKTDYVVIGEEAGSKAERAAALKRPTLDEAAFLAFLEEHERIVGASSEESPEQRQPTPMDHATAMLTARLPIPVSCIPLRHRYTPPLIGPAVSSARHRPSCDLTLEVPMAGYSIPTREDDPIHVVRTIGRIAQMLLELRDEYERRPRPDTLAQIDQRLNDLAEQRAKLMQRRNQGGE